LADTPLAFDTSSASLGGRRRYRPRSQGMRLGLVLSLIIISAGIAVGAFFLIKVPFDAQMKAGKQHESKDYNYSFRYPEKPWRIDEMTQRALKANLVVSRSEPPAHLAIIVKDAKSKPMRDGEIIEEADQRLKSYFRGLQWERHDDEEVAGQRALRIVFQGDADEVPMSGECHMLSRQGFVYWIVAWMPAAEEDVAAQLVAEWRKARAGFGFLNQREGFTEKVPRQIPVTGTKLDYQLRYTEGLWEKRTATDYDANADLALLGRDRDAPKDADKMAIVLALVLPPQADLKAAVAEARAYVEQRLKTEQKTATIDVVKDREGKDEDKATRVGKVPGHIVKLHARVPGSQWEHFILVAVVERPGGVLALECECPMERRTLWETDFNQLLATFETK
jgi:hypothetical protein